MHEVPHMPEMDRSPRDTKPRRRTAPPIPMRKWAQVFHFGASMRIPPHSPTSSALCGAVIARPGHIGKRSLTWRQRVTWAEAVAQWRGEAVLAAWATKSRGERHHASKLTAARALAIKTAPGTYRAISEIHGVSKTTVGEIKTGKAWRHV